MAYLQEKSNDKLDIERASSRVGSEKQPVAADVFEESPDNDFHYKTLSWQVSRRN